MAGESRGQKRAKSADVARRKIAPAVGALDSRLLAPALAIAATLLVYLRCFGNGFVYDDVDIILGNSKLPDWSYIWKSFGHDHYWFRSKGKFPVSAYYRPLQDAWLGLNYHIFGYSRVGWHVGIVAMHLVAVYLVYRIADELIHNRVAAAVAALLFGVMPVHAQAVAWPSAIPLPMAAAFQLGALLIFMHRARDPIRRILLASALYACATLTHESAIVFPIIVAAYLYFIDEPANRTVGAEIASWPRRLAGACVGTLPFVAIASVYLVLRLIVMGFISRPAKHTFVTWPQVFLSMPEAVASYLALLVMPWRAGPAHQFAYVSTPASPLFYLPAIGLAALCAAAWLLARRTAHRRLYLFLAIWAFAAIAPVLNIRTIVIDALISDRYLYMPTAALCIALGELGGSIAAASRERRDIVIAFASCLIALFAIVLWHVQNYWHDDYAFRSKCVEEFPQSSLYRGLLGVTLRKQGNLAAAEDEFKRTLEIRPDDAVTLFNLGHVYDDQGRHREAEQSMARAIAADTPEHELPDVVYLGLAANAFEAGDPASGLSALDHAAANPSTAAAAAVMRAHFISNGGDLPGAERVLRECLGRYPGFAPAWSALGNLLMQEGRNQEALGPLTKAVEVDPNRAESRLALAQDLRTLGREADALVQARQALALEPGNQRAGFLIAELSQELKSPGPVSTPSTHP